MTTLYARLNIQLSADGDTAADAQRLELVLHDAAIEGCADDFEVFYLETLGVVGVAVPFQMEEPWSLFEAGQVLGYVQRYAESSDNMPHGVTTFSASFVDSSGNLVDSTAGF